MFKSGLKKVERPFFLGLKRWAWRFVREDMTGGGKEAITNEEVGIGSTMKSRLFNIIILY